MNYQEIILNELLDKYEKSKSYTHEVNRKISVTVSQMKQYHTENYEEKMYFHEAVKTLQKKNLIDYNWIKHEKENLLDKIWLVKENVSKAYQEINRVNPKEKYTSVFQQLSIIRFHIEWMENFRMDMMQEMNDKQRECTLLPVDHAKDIILALQKIDNIAMNTNTVSVLKRTFSVQCYKNSKHFEREVEKYLLKKGDCVISLTGSRGKRDYGFVCIISDESNYLVNQRVAALRFNTKRALPEFYYYYLASPLYRDDFFKYETGNVGQGNVGIKALIEPMVPVPSMNEQEELVTEIESHLSVCDSIEQTVDTALQQAEAMRQSILKQAFEGRL